MVRRRRRRRPSRGRRIGLGGLALVLLCALAAVALAWWLYDHGLPSVPAERATGGTPAAAGPSEPSPPAPEGARDEPAGEPSGTHPYPTEPEPAAPPPDGAGAPGMPPPPPPAPVEPGAAYLALVIDDLGRSVADVARLEALGVPITYAVLPFESRTPEVVEELDRRGAEVLLHLPMQGSDGADPGPGALTADMGGRALVRGTRRALAAVPSARGVNNHMGSVLSADPRAMRAVLGEVADHDLFFLDSRTTADSVAYRQARELGLSAAERDVFLDPDPAPEAIRREFHRLLAVARREGSAVAIGHPHPATLQVLAEEIPAARALGYRFVPVSLLLDRTAVPR